MTNTTADAQPDIHDALAQHTTDYEAHRELHAVPPHVTYEVTIDGTHAVCKLATSSEADLTTEARIMKFVGRETPIPVPRVLAVGPEHFVAEWHDGIPEEPRRDEEWARAAGAGMATLHAETADAFERTGLLRADGTGLGIDGHPTWPETVAALLERRREFLVGTGYADVATEALAFVREHPEAFDGADDPVLCHGNLLPDHVGAKDGAVTCVIDFEHALVGPGEYDYWRTALPVFGDREFSDRQRAFRAGYESVRALPDGFDRRAALYRAVNGVSYFRSLFLQGQITGEDAERRAERMADSVRGVLADLRARFE